MGNRSNLLTLRPFNLYLKNYKHFEFEYNFFLLKHFYNLSLKLKLFFIKFEIESIDNKIHLNIFVFCRVANILQVSKILKKKFIYQKVNNFIKNKMTLEDKIKARLKFYRRQDLFKKLFNSYKKLSKNLVIYKIINLNNLLKDKKKIVKYIFNKYKKDIALIFPRRFRLFLDFVQITVLLLEKKISASFFLKVLTEIYRILPKKTHRKFFIFIIRYFAFLVLNKEIDLSLKGIKLTIAGKLRGKPRSTRFTCSIGRVPTQTLDDKISFAKSVAHTKYGSFGLRLYILN